MTRLGSWLQTMLVLALVLFGITACGETAVPASGKANAHDEHGEHDEHEDEARSISLTPEQLTATGIVLVQAGPAQIRETLPLYGSIAPNAERVREVAARFPGVIRNVNKKLGDAVQQGATLATVESNESLQTYAVTSPLSGVISMRNANPGEQTGEKALFTVADLSTVWVELALFPRDVAKVRVGQSARVKSGEAGLETTGQVVYVAPFGQAANQTLTARVLLDNPERRWAPGLYVSAEVTLAETPVPLAIRKEAVQNVEGVDVVFVQGAEGFAARELKLGRSDGEYAEVLAGLAAGESYAAANSFILKAELGKGEAEHSH